jgi:anti-anti-sigma factor
VDSSEPQQSFDLVVENDGAVQLVRLSGEFDMRYDQRFDHVVRQHSLDGIAKVIVDLSEVTFIDSTGLRSILRYWNDVRGRGFELAIVPGSPQVQRVLATTGVDKVLPMVEAGATTTSPSRGGQRPPPVR